MPWLAIPFAESELRSKLEKRFKVKGYPTLIMLDEDARMYTNNGRYCLPLLLCLFCRCPLPHDV